VKPLGIALPMLNFQENLLFPDVSTPSGATGRYTLRNFSSMAAFPKVRPAGQIRPAKGSNPAREIS